MFSHLSSLKRQRNGTEAFGFYVAYLILYMLIGAIVGASLEPLMGLFGFVTTEEMSNMVGVILATTCSLALGLAIVEVKGRLHNFWLIVVAALGGLLGVIGGGFLGLLPVAFLTTVAPRKSLGSKK